MADQHAALPQCLVAD